MDILLLVCSLLAITIVQSQDIRNSSKRRVRRVIGGKAVLIEDLPYQVSVQVYNRHFCGGSIISQDWVITAAHCVIRHTSYYIRSGSTFMNKGGVIHKVDKIFKHRLYHMDAMNRPNNDIALMHVKKPFIFDSRQQPIPLIDYGKETGPGVYGTVSGWGDTEWGKTIRLQAVSVPIISKTKCHSKYFWKNGIPDNQICAGHFIGGKDSCRGDSGGPLIVQGQLVGIVSWAIGCGEAAYPGIYTEIAPHRLWIMKITHI